MCAKEILYITYVVQILILINKSNLFPKFTQYVRFAIYTQYRLQFTKKWLYIVHIKYNLYNKVNLHGVSLRVFDSIIADLEV